MLDILSDALILWIAPFVLFVVYALAWRSGFRAGRVPPVTMKGSSEKSSICKAGVRTGKADVLKVRYEMWAGRVLN